MYAIIGIIIFNLVKNKYLILSPFYEKIYINHSLSGNVMDIL